MYFTINYSAPENSVVCPVEVLFRGLYSGKSHFVTLNLVILPCGRKLVVVPACNYFVPSVPDKRVMYDCVFQSINSAFITLTEGGTMFRLAEPRCYFYRTCHTDYRSGYVRNGVHYNLTSYK